MKRIFFTFVIISILLSNALASSEAGAVWLLINPGARYCGMGEAGVAVADNADATFYNPAGLGFLGGKELSLMHVQWLPNLADDLYYDFIAYRHYVKDIGTFGGNIALMNLGEQTATSETGDVLGTFRSYMLAISGSYGTRLSRTSSFGGNFKIIHQHLTDMLAGREKGSGQSTNFAFDLGYMKKEFLLRNLTFGANVANIGNKISFVDVEQADPMPTNLKLGMKYDIFRNHNKISVTYDINKLLVASYPDRDVDGDKKIGGWDEDGNRSPGAEFNKDGKREGAHTDAWYKALFTSWVDDWFLLHDADLDGNSTVGGYDKDGNKVDNGKYNKSGNQEIDAGSFGNELESLVHNFGIEYWYNNQFAVRMGGIYDKEGDIRLKNGLPIMTFGASLKIAGLGADFGYTYGESGHPRANTMFFSFSIKM